jgi:protein TonB
MQLVHAHPPRLQLDAKPILATSGAIARHIRVLMMLMMPAQVATPVEQEKVTIVDWLEAPPLPPPPPPPPPADKPPPTTHVTQTVPVPVPDPPPVNIDQEPGPVDVIAVDPPAIPNTFETGTTSMFQQLDTIAAPAPPYPRNAVARNIEGTVTLRIHVSASGEPMEVSVENSSGSPLLDQAALKFVKARWRFVPAQRDGQATEAWALVPIEFVLH